MHSIKNIFRVGYGPSSSHTIGPRKAAVLFLEKVPEAFYIDNVSSKIRTDEID
jgi:hypothetical protein